MATKKQKKALRARQKVASRTPSKASQIRSLIKRLDDAEFDADGNMIYPPNLIRKDEHDNEEGTSQSGGGQDSSAQGS